MSRILVLASAIAAAQFVNGPRTAAVEKSDSPKRYEYTSKEGNFKAVFPEKPITRHEKLFGIKLHLVFVEDKAGMHMIAFTDEIPEITKESDKQLEKRIDGARDGMLRMTRAELVKEEKIRFEKKYPGREVTAEVETAFNVKLIARIRIYIIDGRLYQVMVLGTKTFIDSAEAQVFCGSFWLTK